MYSISSSSLCKDSQASAVQISYSAMARKSHNLPPPTRFALLADSDRSSNVYLSSVDFPRVVSFEPDRVAEWILYLHRHKQGWVVTDLLACTHMHIRSHVHAPFPQWISFIKTNLPIVLMDIVLEPDMFSLEKDAVKVSSPSFLGGYIPTVLQDVSYGSSILSVLVACLTIMTGLANTRSSKLEEKCTQELLARMDQFFAVMWRNRHIVSGARKEASQFPLDHGDRSSFQHFFIRSAESVISFSRLYTKHLCVS